MRLNKIFIILFWPVLSAVMLTGILAAQTNNTDSTATTQTKPDSSVQSIAMIELDGDIILEEINIEAIVEKPRVSILPKRIEPELGELQFVDRSFEKELKSFPQKLMINDDRLFKPKKIENLKKKLTDKQDNEDKKQ